MSLLNDDLLLKYSKAGVTGNLPEEERVILAKYEKFGVGSFSQKDFYATEYNPDTKMFFGCFEVVSDGGWGFFDFKWQWVSLEILEENKYDRDLFWKPCKFKEIQ